MATTNSRKCQAGLYAPGLMMTVLEVDIVRSGHGCTPGQPGPAVCGEGEA